MRLRPALLAVAVLALVGLLLREPARTTWRTALLITALPGLSERLPFSPQESLTPAPIYRQVAVPTALGPVRGDLYLPAGEGPFGGVVLFLGVAPAGPEDPRVVSLGSALARTGMAVLWVWSETMVQGRMDPNAPSLLVDAFLYLTRLPQVDPERVGLGGFCVGASMAFLASADPHIRDRVAFVNFFGGYADARDLLVAIASRTRFYRGEARPWEPDPLTLQVFRTHLLDALPPEEQERVARALEENTPEPPGLSRAGRAVYRLLRGVPMEEARALVDDLPPSLLALLDRVSPIRGVEEVRAPVLAMHDADDALVPPEESRRLVDALRREGKPVTYTEFALFRHMDPVERLNPLAMAWEVAKLFRHLYRVVDAGT